jgi:regulator of sigma E protease
MAISIIVVFLSLIGLITLHEFGHFILARFFKVKVDEFGIFLPPRIYGKKIGETVWSLNAVPLGAFVKLHGEDERMEDSRSFASKPVWQRALIVAGGVISFWLIAVVIFTYVYTTGSIQPVLDTDEVSDAKVQVTGISADSPASKADIRPGDFIKKLSLSADPAQNTAIDKVAQVQDFTAVHKGEPIVMEVQRGNDAISLNLTPRVDPPDGEGAVGISLTRTAYVSYDLLPAAVKSVATSWDITVNFFSGWGQIIGRLTSGQGMPPGAQFVGPIGIGILMNQAAQMGVNYYLQFVAVISVYLAIFNALPIPALDGGKLVFLGIEAVRKRPVSEKIEQTITAVFFFILIMLAFFVTIGDISRLF